MTLFLALTSVDAGATPLPLEHFETGHLFATVAVKGVDRRFLVDTGANIIVLCSDAAREIGLGSGGKTKSADATDGNVTAGVTELDSLTVAGRTYVDQKVAVIDCAAPAAVLGPFDGVLGGAFFAEADVVLDLAAYTLEVFDPGTFSGHPPEGAQAVDLRLPGGMPYLRGMVGDERATFLFDSGANASSIDTDVAEAIGATPVADSDGRSFGAGGNVSKTVDMRVDVVSVGDVALGPLEFSAEDMGKRPSLGLDAVAGRTLWISYTDQTVWFGPRH